MASVEKLPVPVTPIAPAGADKPQKHTGLAYGCPVCAAAAKA